MKNITILLLVAAVSMVASASSQTPVAQAFPVELVNVTSEPIENAMDELDPFDPNIDEIMAEYDRQYFSETGELPFEAAFEVFAPKKQKPRCFRQTCKIWAQIVKSEQKMYLYVNGSLTNVWPVSTGTKSHRTPNFDMHPNGRIYDKYTSTKYPGGGYAGLGNMPYAVFITGGFAIHGTGKGNWKHLGKPASHGCIRVHPDNALKFNRLVRQAGIRDVWITVQ